MPPPVPAPIHPQARIGHVRLKVSDLERAIAFYHGVLGFEITQRYGKQAAFLSAGGYHQFGLIRGNHLAALNRLPAVSFPSE